MPRASNGTYTLPIAPFAPLGLIKSADHNSNYSDIATALTQSLATTGVSSMTGPIKAASGTVSAPGYTFASGTATGFFLAGTNQIGWAANGVQGATFNSDTSVTWAGNQSIGGTLAVTGNTTLNGTLAVTGTSSFTGKASFTSTDSTAIANGTTGQRNGSPAGGDTRYNSTLTALEFWNGTVWVVIGKAPTYQTLTSGSSATYTPSTGTIRIKVRMMGGGGGGGSDGSNGGNGGNGSSFGGWGCGGGGGGGAPSTGSPAGAGGSGGATGTGTLIARIHGGGGGIGTNTGSSIGGGGPGGNGAFGGGGGAGCGGETQNGQNGATNSGGGGGGAGGSSGLTSGGGGGGSGEYVEFSVTPLSATYTYTVGATASGGVGIDTNGGAGAAGIIIVEEFYS